MPSTRGWAFYDLLRRCDKCYHDECVNVTPGVGQQMDVFMCPTYLLSLPSSQTSASSLPPRASFYSTDPCVEFQWGEVSGLTVVKSI